MHPFVCDITCEPLTDNVPAASVDVTTMVFVLSAISPEMMPAAIRNVSSVMRPGAVGRVLVRDYAAGRVSPPTHHMHASLTTLKKNQPLRM